MKLEKVIIVLPAFNAEKTLEKTIDSIPTELDAELILVDDASSDGTVTLARTMGLKTIQHEVNLGYGANQKTCYIEALKIPGDVVVMLHPDFQYDPTVIPAMVSQIRLGIADMVMGNRISTRKAAFKGGMPKWKYFINRLTTLLLNFLTGQTLGEFHSGFRAYRKESLAQVNFEENSNSFVFDQELILQFIHAGFRLTDVNVPVRYFEDASSISLRKSIEYGWGTVQLYFSYALFRLKIRNDPRFIPRESLN